ncbi:MAG: aminotransferase class I/II-fold pyridoxal phosphate-dependent enzyme [Phycisphaeraceae bacterium]
MFNTQRLISDRLLAIDASGIRKVFDLAAKIKDPINLSIGQPDFDVPQPIQQSAIDAINAGHNRYTQTQGIAELRDAVMKKFRHQFAHDGRWQPSGATSLITAGVSGGLFLAILTCVGPGDEVLIGDPYFVMYKHLVTLAGGRAKFIDTYPDFQLTPARVEPHITDRTKLLILGSPSNPTGVVTPPEVLKQLARLCEQRGILLVSDEIYDEFCYAKVKGRSPSPASFSDNLLVLRGFSKTYGMTGWRLGYAVGPSPLIEQMTKLQQYTFVCAPSMVQDAGVAALAVDMSDHVAAYQRKRDRVVAMLKDRFELTVPEGAFYAFPKVPTGETATRFVERAISKKLLIIPGNVFSERDTHFRISYACEDATLERGLTLLNELAEKR